MKRQSKKRVPKTYKQDPLTLRQALDQIGEWLSEGSPIAERLSAVLAALRGPDNQQDQSVKNTTTGIIRAQAFKKVVVANSVPWSINKFSKLIDFRNKEISTHFKAHINTATKALKLKVKVYP